MSPPYTVDEAQADVLTQAITMLMLVTEWVETTEPDATLVVVGEGQSTTVHLLPALCGLLQRLGEVHIADSLGMSPDQEDPDA